MDSWLEQYEQIVDGLYFELTGKVRDAMIAAGEDPSDKELLCTRRLQVAYGLNSQAQRDDSRRRDEWMLAHRTDER